MSTPTHELEALSLGARMDINRQRAQRARRALERAEKASRDAQSDQLTAGPSGTRSLSPAPTHVRSSTGSVYDIQQLSNNSRKLAMVGFRTEDLSIDKSRRVRVNTDGSYYYAFQFKKNRPESVRPESVRLFEPPGEKTSATCTCEDFRESQTVCAHVFWLYDRLNTTFASFPQAKSQTLSERNVSLLMSNYYDQIGDCVNPETKQLEFLTSQLNRKYDDDLGTDSNVGGGSSSPHSTIQSPAEWVVQDMLSVFDEDYLPSEYNQQDFIEEIATTPTTIQELVNHESLPATMYGLARHDKILRWRLRNAIDKDCCALDFLGKITGRVESDLNNLDQYVLHGPATDPEIVSKCAKHLRQCVREIHEYMDIRAPLSQSTTRKAANIVVQLLCTICERNVDIYDEITWPPTTRIPTDEAKRNLYTNLIGGLPPRPRRNQAVDDGDNKFFLLGCLARFAPNDWSHLLERLEYVRDQLLEHDAPQEYVKRLKEIIDPDENGPDEQTGNASKRPASGDERESQRQRVA